jgi:hypothetical protein
VHGDDFDYVFGASFGIHESNVRLNSMWLSFNNRNWYLDSQLLTQELGLEFSYCASNVRFAIHEELFVENMWILLSFKIPQFYGKVKTKL